MVSTIVIDDDLDVRETLAEFLRIKGVDVVGTGKDGKEALNMFKTHNPDIVIMDIMMPNYDGLYGLKTILEFNNNAKVIMISASVGKQTKHELYDKGAIAVLTKPYDIDEVVQIITQVQKISN